MLNVGRVLNNPRWETTFVVNRKTGQWQSGDFIQNEDPITFSGVVLSPGTKDIVQVPEGDRVSEMKLFLTKSKMYVTHAAEDNFAGTSDEILWEDHRYRLYQVKNWNNFGYYKAIGIMMEGE